MKHVFAHVADRTLEFAEQPIFKLMTDSTVDPRRRLAFTPCMAHFVLTFADLYRFVLPEFPPRDRFQELVNVHVSEEDSHWKWFLADLANLDLDPAVRFTDSVRFLWGDATVASRMLSYHICRLGFGATSIRKLVLVHAVESTGRVALESAAVAGREVTSLSRGRLVYFGNHHLETETEHHIESNDVRSWMESVTLDGPSRLDLCALVDEIFAHFTAFAEEAFRFASRSGAALSSDGERPLRGIEDVPATAPGR